jgi:hypothetical protein
MTIDASGWLDPRLCELAGKTGLRWVYGTQNPWADGPKYWIDECANKNLAVPQDEPVFLQAGVAIDEWIPSENPEIEGWIADGLRAAKKARPDLFILVWFTDLKPTLAELLRDGTVDLGVIEGYTHTPERFGPGAWLAWTTCIRRCEDVRKAELLDKTIFCFGHITDEVSIRGERLDAKFIEEKAKEIKERYPAMPGVAFYQSDSPDTPELRQIVKVCDRVSGRLWTQLRKAFRSNNNPSGSAEPENC